LAAVVVAASVGLCSPAEFRAILRIRSMEFMWALIALVGVMLLGTLKGVFGCGRGVVGGPRAPR